VLKLNEDEFVSALLRLQVLLVLLFVLMGVRRVSFGSQFDYFLF
jgi:hypothetical protein